MDQTQDQNLDLQDTQDLTPLKEQGGQNNQVSSPIQSSTSNLTMERSPVSAGVDQKDTKTEYTSPTQSIPDLANLMDELNNYNPETDMSSVTDKSNSDSSMNNFSDSGTHDASLSISSTTSSGDNSLTNDSFGLSPSAGNQNNLNQPLVNNSLPYVESNKKEDPQDVGSSSILSEEKEEEGERPLTAAAPVPGSIGSAVSYSDVEKKQAEEALKQSKKQNKPKIKLTRTMVLGLIGAVLLMILGIVFVIMFINKNSKQSPTEASGKNIVQEPAVKTLSCIRPLNTNELASVGAGHGNFEKFYAFRNDNLISINETYIYQFNSSSQALSAKKALDASLGITSSETIEKESQNSSSSSSDQEANEQKTSDSSSSSSSSVSSSKKTDGVTEITTTLEDNQIKKITSISESNLENFLKGSTEYSSLTGRDLKTFLNLQNQSGLSCSTVE